MPASSDTGVYKPILFSLVSSLFQPSNRRPGETAPLLITLLRDPLLLGAGRRAGVVRVRLGREEW